MAKKYLQLIIAIALLVGGGTASTASTALANSCGTCQVKPATQTVTENTTSDSTSTTHVHVKVVSRTVKQVKQIETTDNVVVAIDQGKPMHGAGCTDPIRRGWIRVGSPFTNTRHDMSPFADTWKSDVRICQWRTVHNPDGSIDVVGTKSNCRNRHIRIRIRGPQLPKPTKVVKRFKSIRSFKKFYDKWVTKTNHTQSNTQTTTSVVFSCDTANGWQLEGTMCKKCPPPCPPPIQHSTNVRAVTHHDVYSDGLADLCVEVTRDGIVVDVDPRTIFFSPDEGKMVDGTLHKDSSGSGHWCQQWHAPVTAVKHDVAYTVYVGDLQASNTMTVWPAGSGW
jgi:hypothetical protein